MPPLMHNDSDEVRDVPGPLVEFMESRGYALTDSAAEDVAGELRGQALDTALTDAGLSRSGTVEEKRARLAEALATVDSPDTHHDSEER